MCKCCSSGRQSGKQKHYEFLHKHTQSDERVAHSHEHEHEDHHTDRALHGETGVHGQGQELHGK
jgi:hypothetical protein